MKSLLFFCVIIFVVSKGLFAQVATPVFTLNGNELILPSPITFESGTDKITTESEPALLFIKAYLLSKSYISLIRIEGHVATAANSEEAEKLSEKRAMAVAKWLVSHGVECARLLATGFGDTKPLTDDKTAEGNSKNTRISIVNAMLKGKAIGSMPVDGGGWVSGDPCN